MNGAIAHSDTQNRINKKKYENIIITIIIFILRQVKIQLLIWANSNHKNIEVRC